ncbi:hypothetical protein GCM10020229_05150 [Kitasatospora albolonga]
MSFILIGINSQKEWLVAQRSPRGTYLRIADALRAQITGDTELTRLPSDRV